MKYAEQIKEYIQNNGNIGERHEEPAPISIALAKPETATISEPKPKQEAPKKKRGRPAGSKNKTSKKTSVAPVAKKRRSRSPQIKETSLTVGMSHQLFDTLEKAAAHNFRTLSGEICWVLTQYYNGKL